MKSVWKNVLLTRDSGQKEYAHTDDNVFANFERAEVSVGITRQQALLTFLLKHIDGIGAFVKGHKSQREDVRGRIKDAIVYLCLLWAMVDEDELNGEKYEKVRKGGDRLCEQESKAHT